MRRQHGLIRPEILVTAALVAALLGLMAAAVFYVQHVRAKAYDAGKDAGVAEERGRWQVRENVELATANAKILQLQHDNEALERRVASQVAELDAQHQREMRDAERKRERDVAAARAGALTLRLPSAGAAAACQGAGGDAAPGPRAAAGGPDGAGDSEPLRALTAVVVDIAHGADRLALKVGRLQKLARVYYEACGEKAGPAMGEGESAEPAGEMMLVEAIPGDTALLPSPRPGPDRRAEE